MGNLGTQVRKYDGPDPWLSTEPLTEVEPSTLWVQGRDHTHAETQGQSEVQPRQADLHRLNLYLPLHLWLRAFPPPPPQLWTCPSQALLHSAAAAVQRLVNLGVKQEWA